jgi:flavorubredoxin
MAFKIKNNVSWVGKIDWELRKFHGNELSTHRGSSYNSYLVEEQKVALIDAVWTPFDKEFVSNLAQQIDLDRIDFVIASHGEVDHSGSLPELMARIPEKPIYCTANGVKSIKGQYHQDWDFRVVKTGDRLDLGNGKELVFIEAPMLHWPDTMFCYLTQDNILFTSDAFGQHYASALMFNDLVDPCELWEEALKYYANIITPYSPLVTKKINEVLGLKLPVDLICPSHGVIWRENPLQVVEKYLQWADKYQENRIAILYDTMWNGTRIMAERIAEGIHAADDQVNVRLFNLAKSDKNDVIDEVFRAKAVALGSSTVNNGILTSVAAMLEEITGMRFRGKKGAAFGCYGWSGESVGILTEDLRKAGFEIINDGLRLPWKPDEEGIAQCREFGRKLAEACR